MTGKRVLLQPWLTSSLQARLCLQWLAYAPRRMPVCSPGRGVATPVPARVGPQVAHSNLSSLLGGLEALG